MCCRRAPALLHKHNQNLITREIAKIHVQLSEHREEGERERSEPSTPQAKNLGIFLARKWRQSKNRMAPRVKNDAGISLV